MINIITYNILSPARVNSREYLNYDPKYLDNNWRRDYIYNIIYSWVKSDAKPIIGLQEVPAPWKGQLEEIFLENGYRYFNMNYGKDKNAYFGTITAVPSIYEIKKVEYINVGDNIKPVSEEELRQKINNDDGLVGFFKTFLTGKTYEDDEVDKVKKYKKEADDRQNFATKLTLKKDFIFNYYNYHVPAAFETPPVMIYHLDALKRFICKDIYPSIWAGDFNSKPTSDEYRFLTEGVLPDKYKKELKEDYCELKLISAFREVNRREPVFTLYSDTKFGGFFRDTIDYILYTPQLQAVDSRLLLYSNDKMPNKKNPSDHMPLFAQLKSSRI